MHLTSDLEEFAARLRAVIDSSDPHDSPLSKDVEFSRMALELFRLQCQSNAPYRKFLQARGVEPKGINNWREIPAVPAAAFKELELSSIPPAARSAVFHSSGTTQQSPSKHFHNAASLALYDASAWNWFS